MATDKKTARALSPPPEKEMTLLNTILELMDGKVTVLLGVGNRWRGDDSVGTLLAQELSSGKTFHVVNGEDVPENYTDRVRAFQPQTIILVDAVDGALPPGHVLVLRANDLNDIGFSAHHPSLRPLMNYLEAETGAQVVLLGIQRHSEAKSGSLSSEVNETLQSLKTTFHIAADIPRKDIS
jgi:hydrogenase 3 maturation protease